MQKPADLRRRQPYVAHPTSCVRAGRQHAQTIGNSAAMVDHSRHINTVLSRHVVDD
jgi:hypothetical protein